jgi:hypothetical protein
MCNGRRVLQAALNVCVQIKIHMVTLDTNHSVADNTQSIAPSFQKLPGSAGTARHRQSMCHAKRPRFSVSLRLAADF